MMLSKCDVVIDDCDNNNDNNNESIQVFYIVLPCSYPAVISFGKYPFWFLIKLCEHVVPTYICHRRISEV